MAERTDCLLTRDLMLEAVPCGVRQYVHWHMRTRDGRSYIFFS